MYHVESYTIQYATLTRLRWRTSPAAKGATYYMGVNVQGDRWTGSILRSSSKDLIDWHRFLWKYLEVFKVSFRGEVVTPGVTANSVLTSAKCQRHTSSIWPWSGVPKVRLNDTFLGGLRHVLTNTNTVPQPLLHMLFCQWNPPQKIYTHFN